MMVVMVVACARRFKPKTTIGTNDDYNYAIHSHGTKAGADGSRLLACVCLSGTAHATIETDYNHSTENKADKIVLT